MSICLTILPNNLFNLIHQLHTLGSIKRSMAGRLRDVILPLFSTLVRPYLDSYIQLCSPQHRKDMDLLE